ELERQALRYIDTIDGMGGTLAALGHGYQMREIQEAAFKHQREVEEKQRIIVGVNEYVTEEPPLQNILRVDPQQERLQVERLLKVRRERDNGAVTSALKQLEEVAKGTENTMPAIVECVEAYATVGEISDVLRGVFGEQVHSVVV
ncbi:MAG: methylmalonyl-CoA mutase family protein, partial [Chloroflexi bacterium]|nr:methylmalonyl-CoA mutase family protein [Chloroflexota bacterium]